MSRANWGWSRIQPLPNSARNARESRLFGRPAFEMSVHGRLYAGSLVRRKCQSRSLALTAQGVKRT